MATYVIYDYEQSTCHTLVEGTDVSKTILYPYYTIRGHAPHGAPVYSVEDTRDHPVGLCHHGQQHAWVNTEEADASDYGRASEECINCRLQRRWAP